MTKGRFLFMVCLLPSFVSGQVLEDTLDTFEKELYDVANAGKRWIFVPRATGEQYALAIVVVGLPGKTEIPADICCSHDFDEIGRYAETLNSERDTRWHTGEMPMIPEAALI